MSALTAPEVLAAFHAQSQAELAVERTKHDYDLAVYGGASIAAQTEAFNAWLAAKRVLETPAQTVARLKLEEADKRYSAERHAADEVSYAGRIAFALQVPEGWTEQRNPELAKLLEPQRRAAGHCAARALQEAEAIARSIADLTRRAAFADHVLAAVA